MKTFRLINLVCFETEDSGEDEVKIEVFVDNNLADTLNKDMNEDSDIDTFNINKDYDYNDNIRIKVWDKDGISPDDLLGEHVVDSDVTVENLHLAFSEDDADYDMTFSIFVQGTTPVLDEISIRKFFSRLGVGIMNENSHEERIRKNTLYRIDNEVLSLRDAFSMHAPQDGNKSNTTSVRMWVRTHCNFFSNETVITDKPESDPTGAFFSADNWDPVNNEQTKTMAGFQDFSRVTYTDNPVTHETRDFNWDLVPDPTFMYMLGAGFKREKNGLEIIPIMHNEWETGSFPVQWRPFWGEYVTMQGRHIWDKGHSPVSAEIHPAHTLVREITTSAPIGDGNTFVPVNQAKICMGMSGGFPHDTEDRWDAEFGGVPDDVWGDSTNCWATNLKNHPIRFKLYPPTERPLPNATLVARVKFSEFSNVNNWDQGDDFLELCQNDDPASGGEDKGFRDWHDFAGFEKQVAPANMRPNLTLREGPGEVPGYFEVAVDLSAAPGIVTGYMAVVECGWNVKGTHSIKRYRVTFETIKAIQTDESWDDWHHLYGVNGQWSMWWTDDFVEEGEVYQKNRDFTVFTVDDQPIVIRDNGVEWDGTDFGNEKMDRVDLVLEGPDHFASLIAKSNSDSNVNLVTQLPNLIRFKVKGTGGDTRHEWTIVIELMDIV